MKKYLLLILILLAVNSIVFAQLEKPVKWSFYVKKIDQTTATIYIKAKMSNNWHIYAQSINTAAMKLKFTYIPSKDYVLDGKTIEPKPIKKYDQSLAMELVYFEKEVVFTQKIKLNKASTLVKMKVEFMACNDKQCLPADEIILNIPVK